MCVRVQPSSDMAVGDKVLSGGDLVGPAEIGLLATVGAVMPKVVPQVPTPIRFPPVLSPSPVYALGMCDGCDMVVFC